MSGQAHDFLEPRVLVPFTLIILIWGSTWLVITSQLGIVPPAWSISYRFLIGAATMFVYAAATGSALRIGRNGHLLAMAFGIPQFCVNFNCVYLAEQHVTSGVVAVVFALLLVPNSLFAWLFLKHRMSGRFVVGSAIAIAGVAMLFVHELGSSGADRTQVLAGIGLTLAGVFLASIANIIQASERLRARSLPGMIAWGMFYGVLANVVIAWAVYGPPVIDTRPAYLAGLLYLGLVASALAFSLYFTTIRLIGPGRAAYSSLLIPILAMILSTIFEGYRWSPLAVAGCVVTLAGLFVALRARRAQAETGRG